MASIGLIPFVLFAFLQALPAPLLEGDVLNAEEKARLGRAQKLDDRIKVYQSASKRMQQSMHSDASKNDFSGIPQELNLWGALLSGSLEDIEANLKTKKKSNALIRYEIQVRKTLTDLRGYRAKAPIDQQDAFDSKLAEAETIRKKFVDLIFQ